MAVIGGTTEDDAIVDTVGDDNISGLAGNDVITVRRGNDVVDAGAGDDDTLIANYASAVQNLTASIFGDGSGGYQGFFGSGLAADYIAYVGFRSVERFVLTSGAGDDFFDIGTSRADIDMGTGVNGVSADYSSATGDIRLDIPASQFSGPGSIIGTISYVGTLLTGAGNDLVITDASSHSEIIVTGSGDDSVSVARGSDVVDGGAGGTDTLLADYGAATVNLTGSLAQAGGGYNGVFGQSGGGAAGWFVDFRSIERFVLVAGAGDDFLDISSADADIDLGSGVNGVAADKSAATAAIALDLVNSTYSGPGSIIGNINYVTTFLTGSGDDVIITNASARSEIVATGAGDDSITVSRGTDVVDGGAGGTDTLVAQYGAALVNLTASLGSAAGGGYNGVFGQSGGGANGWFVDFRSIERFVLTAGAGDDFFDISSADADIDLGSGFNGIAANKSGVSTAIQLDLVNFTYSGPGSISGNINYVTTFLTGTGDDVIVTAASLRNETIGTGAGNDSITIRDGNDTVDAGSGTDTLIADYGAATENLVMAISASGSGGFSGSFGATGRLVSFLSIERFVLTGGSGNDVLQGGSGADLLGGGGGDDLYRVDRLDDLVFEDAGGGTDTVIATSDYYLFAGIENLTLAAGSGDRFGVGNELANVILGTGGSNLLIGGAGNDAISGGGGIDSLFGEDGDDALNGDAGIDYLVGGTGNDVIDGGVDADALYGEDGDDVLVGGGSFHTDIMVGGAGNDVVRGDSGLGDYDLMDGGAGDDSYHVDTPDDLTFEAVGGGTDTVYAGIVGAGYYLYANTENLVLLGNTPFGVGNELDNLLTGNAIGNYLLGGAGNDVLNGKAGNDVLFGEAGADRFVFESGSGGDVIGDFEVGIDRIDLSGLGFVDFAAVQAAFVEVDGTTAINHGGGDLVVINGVANAALSAADFILG